MARKPTDKQLFKMKNEWLGQFYEKVEPKDFYRAVFPKGSFEREGHPEDEKCNGVLTVIEGEKARNYIVFDELNMVDEVKGKEFAIMSPVGYSGRNRTAKNARWLYGIAVDLDGVEMEQLRDLFHQMKNEFLPQCTYCVNSGHGLHLYYLFEKPVPLYRHLQDQLREFKYELIRKIWNRYTSTYTEREQVQYQGIFQGFRMVGSQSKLGKRYPVVAFKTGEKTTIETLNWYVDDQYRMTDAEEYRMPLEEAKAKYPEWYQKRVVEGDRSRKKWNIAGKVHGDNPYALYDWWIAQMRKGAFDGNRYNCIATLITYAIKCDIDKEKVLTDALELVPWLNSLTEHEKNEFTEQDVYDAFTYFDDAYANYSIKAIEARTKIQIERNKRNGRKQEVHLGRARAVQAFDDPEGSWRNKKGRPKGSGTAQQRVAAYRAEHPEASVTEIAKALRISRPTVYKWWDS